MRRRIHSRGMGIRLPRALLFRFGCALVCVLIAVLLIDARIKPIVRSLAQSAARSAAVEAVNFAVADTLALDGSDYSDLVRLEKDSEGKISSVMTDVLKINTLKTRVTALVARALDGSREYDMKVPLGALFKSEAWSGAGPCFTVKLRLVGSAVPSVTSVFSSAGINQTLHRLVINIDTHAYIYLPSDSCEASIQNSIIIAETVIVGTVPEALAQVEQ